VKLSKPTGPLRGGSIERISGETLPGMVELQLDSTRRRIGNVRRDIDFDLGFVRSDRVSAFPTFALI
jgi:hypothetical protein